MGPQLSRYEVLGRLASGSSTGVWLARTRSGPGAGALVVVKALLSSLASRRGIVEHFLADARLAALLEHPNCARVLDSGEQGGVPYVAMEFVEGFPISRVVRRLQARREPAPFPAAARLLLDTAAALECVHQQAEAKGTALKLVHRDVTADAVLVSFDGKAKLLVFGVAQASGTVKGPVACLAPEALKGDPVDFRADLFGLGVLAYRLLTGVRPFIGKSDELTTKAIINDNPLGLRSLRPDIPAALDQAVRRALAKNPAERFESARAFAQAVEAAVPAVAGTGDVAALMDQLWSHDDKERRALVDLAAGRAKETADPAVEDVVSGETALPAEALTGAPAPRPSGPRPSSPRAPRPSSPRPLPRPSAELPPLPTDLAAKPAPAPAGSAPPDALATKANTDAKPEAAAPSGAKKEPATAKSEALPSSDVKKEPATAKSEALPSSDVKKEPATAKSEATTAPDVKKEPATAKSEALPSSDTKKEPGVSTPAAVPSSDTKKEPGVSTPAAVPSSDTKKEPAASTPGAAPPLDAGPAPSSTPQSDGSPAQPTPSLFAGPSDGHLSPFDEHAAPTKAYDRPVEDLLSTAAAETREAPVRTAPAAGGFDRKRAMAVAVAVGVVAVIALVGALARGGPSSEPSPGPLSAAGGNTAAPQPRPDGAVASAGGATAGPEAAPEAPADTTADDALPVEDEGDERALPAAAADGPTGKLRLVTEPPVSVAIDGTPKGRTPLTLTVLAGKVKVRFYDKKLRLDTAAPVVVKAGETTETTLRFEKATLEVRVAPWANVTIDGVAIGPTPIPVQQLWEGKHVIELKNPELKKSKRLKLRLKAGEKATVRETF